MVATDAIKEVRLYEDWSGDLYLMIVYYNGVEKTFVGAERLPPASWAMDVYNLLNRPQEWFDTTHLMRVSPDIARRWGTLVARAAETRPGNIRYIFHARTACKAAYRYVLGITEEEES